ncbi:unnamed protein product [Lactuca virosa]|uniref:Rho termination factor-like N-terminal domain-containing protein n=1 Tax=Lactuca virosa TaxID=75947 RepID=A0AAU9NRY7_9ASTR|nr:unnamed protein product [Lactuca virosa]
MESVITCPHYVPGLHPIFAFSKSKLGRLGFSLKEFADGHLFAHPSTLQFPISNIRTDGNRRVRFAQRNHDSGRSINGDDNKTPQSSEGKTYNKDEILALFRRIQSSISGESNASKGRTKNASAESVLEVLRQSRKQVKGKSSNREGSMLSGEWKKEEIVDFKLTDAKISRPPSNFTKRSPIPSIERVQQDEVKSESEGLETMKLADLKELAKSRGIKGYSKLKKAHLVDLLRTV